MHCILFVWLLLLLFDSEDEGNMFLRNEANVYQITWTYIPEYGHCCENLKS
jgi:hypothetical protein